MSGILDLGDLFLTVSETVKRADFANVFLRFVKLTEDRISEALRIEDGSTTVTITADVNGRAALPTDFREARVVRLSGGDRRVLTGGSLQSISASYPLSGTPAEFAIGGGFINLMPPQAASIELTYWAGMPRLTAVAPSNPMLLRYGACYLYGVAEQVFLWANDVEAVKTARDLFEDAMARAVADNEGRVMALSRLRISGVIA